MTIEIPGSPRRNGMVCWQIRHERQPDGTLKMRREYGMPDDVECPPAPIEPAPEPTTRRGIAVETQRKLL